MKIEDLLEAKKKEILEKWFNQVIETYANDTAHFLKNQKDPFHNPVGSNVHSGLNGLMNGLIDGSEDDLPVKEFLDRIEYPLTRTPGTHIYVHVIGVPAKHMPASFKFLIQIIQQDIG